MHGQLQLKLFMAAEMIASVLNANFDWHAEEEKFLKCF